MTVRLLVFTSLLLISGGESGSGSSKRRSPQPSSSSSGGSALVDFDCPEEFGYYAHPSDCTQYYVCVFGGALLESCTGGLMYSHELQTCDWPRNVGCAPGTTASQQVQQVQPETRQRQSSPPQRERIIQQQIPKHDLYTEDEQLPAEELDSDRQQRVYRGQPQSIGQVQSDRDGLSTHSNAIPVPGRDKLSVVSYGTQQQYTSLYRLKPTGDVIQDKSDHNFLTNVTRRIKRQAPIRSHQDGRPESYDSSPISWSSFQPRIIHHRRPQLIPSVFPSPQPPPPHPSHSSLHSGGLRPRPMYHTHRRPNEFKFEPSDAKNGKFVSTTTLRTPIDASSRPNYYVYHNQPSFSAPVESKYHIVHSKQSTFRPSFGPPAYQPYQTNTDMHTTQRYESTTRNPSSTYRTQVTKPPLTHHSSTIRNTAERKPTSYVYSSNSLHKDSGLQLNQESISNAKPNEEDGDSTDEDADTDDEYEEDEDTTNEEKQRSKESRESHEKGNSNENASVSKSSNESFRPKFPNPPPNFYKDSNSASESLEEKNPFANPDFDFNKFLDDLRDHPQSGGPSTSSQLYFEYSPSSSSKESSQVNDYYYPRETTPKYYHSVEDGKNKYSLKDSPHNNGQSYSKDTSYKQDDYSSSKESSHKPNYNPLETQGVSQDTSSKNHHSLKQSSVNFIEPNNSPEDTTSKYFYNTGKQNHIKYSLAESTPKYNVFPSSEQPIYTQSPQYYFHPSGGGRIKNDGQYKHPSSFTFTTEKPSSDSNGNGEEYIDDFVIGKGKNSSLLGPPRPPKQPFRLQNIDNHALEEEEEDGDENEDDSEEYYDDEEDDEQGDDEEYEDEEDETPVNENDSESKEKPKSEEDSRRPSQPSSASIEHMTSNTKHTQSVKPTEHTTPNQLIKSTSSQAEKCFTVRGKVKCLDSPSTTSSTSTIRHRPSVVYPNINHYQSVDHTSSTLSPSPPNNGRPRMRRPTSPLPPPSTVSSTLAPPPHKFTSPYGTNSSRQTPMLLSPSYPNSSTESVAVIAKKPKQRQNRNKSELSEDTDMRDKGHTQRALTRLRASVTPAQQQYVEQQTTQQQTTPPRTYNQSRYVPSQYDPPFYTLYDDEVDLYKEIGDYAQYNTQGSNQYRNQATYKEKKPQIEIVQQEPVRGSAYSKNKYNTQSDIYQSVTPQEYESYSIQTNDDLPYRQPQQTKSSTRSEVKETEGSDRSHVSTASSGVEKKPSPEQTVQQTDSTTVKHVTPQLPEGPKAERLVSDDPFVIQIGGIANTPSPFKLPENEPESEPESPVNLLTRGHFIVREPEVVTQQVIDITPKPNNRNRGDSSPQRTIAIRVPQAAIDLNKFNSNDDSKQKPAPIRASDSAEWSGFRLGGEVGSNYQEEVSRRPSLRVPDSIKIREEYLRGREGAGKSSRRNNEEANRSRTRNTQDGRGSSRYQESVYELDEFTESSPSPQPDNQQNIRLVQSTPSYRANAEEEQQFLVEAERNARIQAQLRSSEGSKANQRNENDRVSNAEYRRRQEELRRKAYEDARVRQIEDAEREAKEQIRQKQYEDARLKKVEEAERIAEEIAQKKEIEEAQRRANEEARRRLIEEAKRRASEEARRKQIEESQRRAREEYERKEKEEAMRKAVLEEQARKRAEEEEEARKRQLLEARRAKEEAERKAAIEKAQRRAAVEEAQRKAAAEEAQRKADIEEAQRRAAVEEAQRKADIEEAQRRAAVEEAQRKADIEEAQRRAAVEEAQRSKVQEAKKKAADETRRKHMDNQRQLEEGLPRRRLPSRTSSIDPELSFRPSSGNTERYRSTSRQGSGFRIVVDTTESSENSPASRTSPFGDLRPPKKYVSRNSTLVNELYLNEQSTSFPDNTVSVTPNTLIQTSPGRTYTENTRKTLDTPIPISKSDPEYSEKSVRVRPTSYDTQSTPGLTRGSSRHRGSQSFTISPNDAESAPQPANRGTPAAPRVRPTLKPSTTVVGKASEYIDIYRYPPRRPDNVYPTPQVDKTAAKCRKDVCLIPDCSCGGKDIPGDLTLEETPQIVLLTFDDSVNDLNKGLYEDLFEKGRVNPNGCPISGTFYVSHEWTDYSQVQNLYSNGHEIASHSVSHSFGEQFSQKKWTKEISGQREILSAYGGVKMEDIRGMRAPFLAIGGNKMFKMLYDSNFTYDSSMPVYENKPPSWPYTMDYKIFHDCMIPPCPTKSYPGVWEVPMVMWQDLNGGRCSMGDACSNPPNAEGVYKMLIKNFERHFTTNRAPFGLYYHAAWFTQPHHKEGFIAFLDTINKMPEVWLVNNWQAIQWVRDPTPINRLNNFAPFTCNYQDRPKKCNNPKVCNLWHKSGVRYMRTCQPCPDVYPWTGKSGVRNSRVDNEIINE